MLDFVKLLLRKYKPLLSCNPNTLLSFSLEECQIVNKIPFNSRSKGYNQLALRL